MADVSAAAGKTGADSLRWNFFANVMDGALFSFGMSFVSQLTVLPLLVRSIGGGNVAVGLIPVVWTLGFNFPQFLIVGRAERQASKKPLLLKTAIGQRIPWLLLALVTYFFFGRVSMGAALAIFFVLYSMAAVGGSLNLPVWFDLIARLTPVRWRGRLFGIRSVAGSLLGIVGGAVVSAVLGEAASPEGFGLLLLLAFLSLVASYIFLMTLKEPSAGARPVVRTAGPGPVRTLLRQLRVNRNLRNFIVADSLQISAGMALAFLTVVGVERFSLPASAAGTFTMIVMGSMIAGGLVFGAVADRFGHRTNLFIGAAATFLSAVIALLAKSPALYVVVFVCAGLTVALGTISRLPFLAELAGEGERPSVIALANMISSPFVFWGAIGGVVADAAGYEWVFLIAGCFALCAAVWLLVMVRDPRTEISRPAVPYE